MSTLFAVALPFFGLIACGYLAGRVRWVGQRDVTALNRFVVLFALPGFVFSRIAGAEPALATFDWSFMLAYAGATLAVGGVALLAARLLFRSPMPEATLVGLAGSFSNTGYIGLPLAVATFGDAAAFPAILTFTFDNTLMLLLAMSLVEASGGEGGAGGGVRGRAERLVLRNPLFICIGLGMLVQAVSLPVPEVVLSFARLLGGAAGPGGLFALGASLALRDVAAGGSKIGLAVGLKLVAHPLAVAAAMALVAPDPLWRQVAILSASLPIGATVYVLAAQYGVAVPLISTAVLVSTAISAATVTLLIAHLVGSG